jgi:VIT1/CCC1 family predicted Fe2+/Mn2+ transporter
MDDGSVVSVSRSLLYIGSYYFCYTKVMSTRISSISKHHPLHSRRRKIHIPFGAQRFLAAFEGLEGGFAASSSVLVALAIAGLDYRVLLITAIVSSIVNAFNSASLKYSSEHFLDELDGREKRSPFREYLIPAFIEFVSYLVISFITIAPLFILSNIYDAVWISVVITVSLLFAAGYFRAYMLHMPRLRDSIETAFMGVCVIVVGAMSGVVFSIL